MTRLYLLFFMLTNFISCVQIHKKSQKIELVFLDEYVLPANQIFNNTKIGGLSGIDFFDGNYYLVVDDSKLPRYYKTIIEITLK